MSTDTALAPWAPTQHDRDAFGTVREAGRVATQDDRAGSVTLRGVDAGNLAAGDGDVITGISLVKPGTFNGYFEVNRENLDAWVARFAELYPDTFEPPMRLNHSWDIESVIGWFTDLRVENRPDVAAGGTVVPMLVGDLRLVGTPAENAQIRAWIKSGKLSKVSSEFWPYHTNAGVEYPSVFAGAAFVDIPAAEGLGPIALRRATLDRSTSTDTPEGTDMPNDDEQPTTTEVEETAPVVEETAPEEDAPTLGDPEVDEPDGDDDDDTDQRDAGDLAASLAALGVNLSREQGVALEAEITRRANLRTEADQRIAKFRTKGVMPLKVADKLEGLLRHTDATVRDTVAEFLELAVPPVKLREKVGVVGNEPTSKDGAPSPTELAAMDFDTYTEAWAALTSEQRNTPEYRAAYREA